MATSETKVRYNTEEAEESLEKLDKKVKKSGDTAQQSFGKASNGLGKFGSTIGRVNPKLGSLASGLGNLAGTSGGLAIGFSAAGAAIIATVGNAIGLAEILKDVDATLEGIVKTGERVQSALDLQSAIADAQEDFEFIAEREQIAFQQSELTKEQIATDAARRRAQEELSIERDKFRDLKRLADLSIREREAAEDRLARKRSELAGDTVGAQFRGRPAGRQVVDLAARAQQEAQRGNIDNAEALIDRAKELSDELGNHVFFTDKIDTAQKAVLRALEEDVDEAKDKESALQQQVREQGKAVEVADRLLDRERDRTNEIREQLTLLSDRNRLLREEARAASQAQLGEQASRTLDTAQGNISELFGEVGGRTGGERFAANIRATLRGFLDPFSVSNIGADAAQAAAIEDALINGLRTAFEDDQITPDEAFDLTGLQARIEEQVGNLRRGIEEGTVNSALEERVSFIEKIVEEISRIGTAAEQAGRAGVGNNQGIRTGAQNLRQSVSGGAAQPERIETRQTINVNANVKGGIIDAETTRRITAIIRTELRKQTAART